MKISLLFTIAFVGTVSLNAAVAEDHPMNMESHHHDMNTMDARTSLGLPAKLKQHHLAKMREHLEAVRSIVGLLSENKFEDASKLAHSKLGLTPEMREMCDMFENEKFRTLGFAFHKSGDELGDTLAKKDVNASLRALNKTMQYCVECHATYRQ